MQASNPIDGAGMPNARPPITLLIAAPRGFCAGVDRAIRIVELALERYGAPVYVRHEIVHNKFVVEGLKAKGAIFVPELDQVPDGVPVGPFNHIGIGEGIVGGLGSGEPAIVNDIAADPRSSPVERDLGALIVAPLRERGVAIGAIGAATAGPHEYEAGDLKVLTAIASLTGPAIAQARSAEVDPRLLPMTQSVFESGAVREVSGCSW